MTPFASFEYFLFLLYPLVLAIVLGLLGRLGPRFVLVATLAVVAFQVGNPLGTTEELAAGLRQLVFLGAYLVGAIVLILGFAYVRRRGKKPLVFYVAVGLALLPLVAVKVAPLLATRSGLATPPGLAPAVASASASPFDAFGFLGISYATFRVIDAIVTLQDGLTKVPMTPLNLASYVLFFPTISSGPIDRYNHFVGELSSLPHGTGAYLFDLEAAIQRVAQGFLYKFILAYVIYQYGVAPAAAIPGVIGELRYMYRYSLYLFFDFAGYSAFAIGVGRFFGVRVPENFDAPFISRNIQEMWNRWHISLSWWMRDHVYRRFLLLALGRGWFGGYRQVTNWLALLLTMGLMGLWHGLLPHYIVYGLYQGGMLVVYDWYSRWNRRRQVIPDTWLSHAGSVFLTVNSFCFGLLIFSGHLFV